MDNKMIFIQCSENRHSECGISATTIGNRRGDTITTYTCECNCHKIGIERFNEQARRDIEEKRNMVYIKFQHSEKDIMDGPTYGPFESVHYSCGSGELLTLPDMNSLAELDDDGNWKLIDQEHPMAEIRFTDFIIYSA